MRGRVWAGAVIALGVLLAGAACSSDAEHQAAESEYAEASAAPRTPVDPPQHFDASTAVDMPDGSNTDNIAVDKTTAFVNTSNGLMVFDTTTNRIISIVNTTHTRASMWGAAGKSAYRAPLIATTAAGALAFVPVPVTLPGQGTTPATPATDILVIDAASGTLVRTVTVSTPARRVEEHATQAIAVTGDDVIFTDAGRTYRVNFTSGAVVWQLDNFEAVTLAGGRLIGIHTTAALTDATRAIDPSTTATFWTEDGGGIGLKIQPGGPNFVIAVGTGYFKIFTVADGTVTESGRSSIGYDLTCLYDQQATVVCGMQSTPWTSAFDATSGTWLWELPDTPRNRTSIKLTAAWHGRAYGKTANGPIVLDARTGADKVPTAATAPLIVNAYLGIAEGNSGLKAYPTIKEQR